MIRALLFLLLLPFTAQAADLPKPLSDTVSDYASVLDPATEQQLTTLLKSARRETGVQMVVVTMRSINDFGGAGQSIETYAETLFNAWGVGNPARNDGILMLVAVDDRAMRIALGSGYAPVYDSLAKQVIDRDMLPKFRDKLYSIGIVQGAEGSIADLARPFGKNQTPAAPVDWVGKLSSLFPFLLVGGVLLLSFKGFIGGVLTRFRACPSCGQRGMNVSTTIIQHPTSMSSGSGLRSVTCPHCSYHSEETYTIPMRSRSNGGGSSGFGGGRSSGGGASGRW